MGTLIVAMAPLYCLTMEYTVNGPDLFFLSLVVQNGTKMFAKISLQYRDRYWVQ